MGFTAFFIGDRLGADDTGHTIGPFGERPGAPFVNCLNDRPRVVWQTPPYGYFALDSGQYLDVNEGGGELRVKLSHFAGSGPGLALDLEQTLNNTPLTSLSYTVTYTIDHRFKIEASSTFSILWSTGTDGTNQPYKWLGFSNSTDSSGASSYSGIYRRYGTDHWAFFDLGSTLSADVAATILDGGDSVSFNTSSSLVRMFANASPLSATDVKDWVDNAAKTLTFTDRPGEDENKIQVAYDSGGASMSYRYWAFSWRYFDIDPFHAVGIVKLLQKKASSTRQVAEVSNHGLVDETAPINVKSYYPSQGLIRWRTPLSFDNWLASDFRSVVTPVVREGKATALLWALRWDEITDSTRDADDEADKGFLLWCGLQDYSLDSFAGSASAYITADLLLEQVR